MVPIILGADDTGLCGRFSRCFLAHDMGFMYRFCYGFFYFTHDMGVMRRPNGQAFFHFFDRWHENKWANLHMTWDFTPQEMGHPRWELAGREMGRGILPQEMGHLRWGGGTSKMGTGRWNWQVGNNRRWDIQGGNWQIGRREEEFTAGDGTSKVGAGR